MDEQGLETWVVALDMFEAFNSKTLCQHFFRPETCFRHSLIEISWVVHNYIYGHSDQGDIKIGT